MIDFPAHLLVIADIPAHLSLEAGFHKYNIFGFFSLNQNHPDNSELLPDDPLDHYKSPPPEEPNALIESITF